MEAASAPRWRLACSQTVMHGDFDGGHYRLNYALEEKLLAQVKSPHLLN